MTRSYRNKNRRVKKKKKNPYKFIEFACRYLYVGYNIMCWYFLEKIVSAR